MVDDLGDGKAVSKQKAETNNPVSRLFSWSAASMVSHIEYGLAYRIWSRPSRARFIRVNTNSPTSRRQRRPPSYTPWTSSTSWPTCPRWSTYAGCSVRVHLPRRMLSPSSHVSIHVACYHPRRMFPLASLVIILAACYHPRRILSPSSHPHLNAKRPHKAFPSTIPTGDSRSRSMEHRCWATGSSPSRSATNQIYTRRECSLSHLSLFSARSSLSRTVIFFFLHCRLFLARSSLFCPVVSFVPRVSHLPPIHASIRLNPYLYPPKFTHLPA